MPNNNSSNAKQNVQNVYDKLVDCMDSLNQALTSVEKTENKQRIKSTLGAVDNAIEAANHTLANYQE
jgi:molecular chaperone GrpE (heat shock protein)